MPGSLFTRRMKAALCFFISISSSNLLAEAPTRLSGLASVGDSVMAGYGVQKAAGEFSLFHDYLQKSYKTSIATKDLATPGATSQGILNSQVSKAIDFVTSNADTGVAITVNGGGNDLLAFTASSSYRNNCLKGVLDACYASVNKILDSAEKNLNSILSRLRQAAGPANPIFVLTYANSKASPGCASAQEKILFAGALEGVAGSALDRGLNSRIRELAETYDARVVELGTLLRPEKGGTIAGDCIHPNAAGYGLIANELARLFTAP